MIRRCLRRIINNMTFSSYNKFIKNYHVKPTWLFQKIQYWLRPDDHNLEPQLARLAGKPCKSTAALSMRVDATGMIQSAGYHRYVIYTCYKLISLRHLRFKMLCSLNIVLFLLISVY